MRKIYLSALLIPLNFCAKPRPAIMPCDEDLGFSTRKLHLANVDFLNEDRAVDWYEIYENLTLRRTNTPAEKCIPHTRVKTIEQNIDSVEHSIKELR